MHTTHGFRYRDIKLEKDVDALEAFVYIKCTNNASMVWKVNEHMFLIPDAFAPEAQDHVHGPDQDLILRLTAGKRNIRGATRTTGSSGATTVASGDRTTSEVEGGATFSGGATSAVVAGEDLSTITTTTTSGQTGRITSRTCTKSSGSNSSTGRRPGLTIPRRSQRAPRMAPSTTWTNPPPLYPGSPITRPPPHTHPPPKTSRRVTKTPKM